VGAIEWSRHSWRYCKEEIGIDWSCSKNGSGKDSLKNIWE